MTDVFQYLEEFSWRDKEYPVSDRRAEFAHENVRHRLVYRNGEYLEAQGPQTLTLRYTVPMREDIAKGPFKNLFSVGLKKLFDDMQDKTPGPLVDPVYGPLTCVPERWSDNLDPNKRDGADVEIEFSVFQDIDEEVQVTGPSLEGLVTDAGKLDKEVEKAFREKQKKPPGSVTDPLSAAAGVGAQLQRNRDRVTSTMAATSAQLRKVERQVDELEDPVNGDLKNEARRMQVDAARLSEKAEPNRLMKVATINTVKSIADLAKDLKVTIQQLLDLNPSLAKSPTVPPGTSVSYYAD